MHGAYHRLVCGDWWDEDARSPAYNTFRHVACGARPPFGGGSEALWRISPQYRYFAVIEYNAAPSCRGRGSAIFLHVSAGRPTAGCVSLPEAELVRVLRWLRPAAHPLIHLGFLAVRRFGVALEPVVRDRLPRRGVGDVRAERRPDAGSPSNVPSRTLITSAVVGVRSRARRRSSSRST